MNVKTAFAISRTAQEAAPLLDESGYADCPHCEGGIQFSAEFDWSDYRELSKLTEAKEGDLKDAFFNLEPQWRAIARFATRIELQGGRKEGGTVTEASDCAEVLMPVLRWASDAFDEWLTPFLAGDDWRDALSRWVMGQVVKSHGR